MVTGGKLTSAVSGGQITLTEDTQAAPAVLEMYKDAVLVFIDRLEVVAPGLVDMGPAVTVMSVRLRKCLKKLATPCDAKHLCGVGNNVWCPLGLSTVRVQISEHVLYQ